MGTNKVIVTGAAGFIAHNLILRLLEDNVIVIGVDNLSRGGDQNLVELRKHKHFTFIETDLARYSEIEQNLSIFASDVHEVWHLAANSDISAGTQDPTVDLRDTFMSTFNILLFMSRRNISKLYFASSSAVYGDHGSSLISEAGTALLPISNYGAMKMAAEAQISAAVEAFLEQAMIFRFPNVVGVPATHGVIFDFINKLSANPSELQVLGDGSQQKSYLLVDELLDAMFYIKRNANERIGIFNIGPKDDPGVSVRFIAETVKDIAWKDAEIVYGSENRGWLGDVPRFTYSVDKLSSLGWTASLSSAQAILIAAKQIYSELSK